jgi:hypothetical protein
MKEVCWDQPIDAISFENEVKCLTEAEAIAHARREHHYDEDQHALEDLMVVHWAWIIDEKD